MTREAPLVEGQHYLIYNRGNNGCDLFLEPRNYRYFLILYIRYIHPIADTFAYCLLPNHLHLLVRMKPAAGAQEWQSFEDCHSSSAAGRNRYTQAFANLFSTYSKAINKGYDRSGSLFEKPFQRIPVQQDRHLLHLVCYIHRNPQRHGLIADFRHHPHSSYAAIAGQRRSRLAVREVLEWFGGAGEFERYHQQFDGSLPNQLMVE